jgi:hypothetical protein
VKILTDAQYESNKKLWIRMGRAQVRMEQAQVSIEEFEKLQRGVEQSGSSLGS